MNRKRVEAALPTPKKYVRQPSSFLPGQPLAQNTVKINSSSFFPSPTPFRTQNSVAPKKRAREAASPKDKAAAEDKADKDKAVASDEEPVAKRGRGRPKGAGAVAKKAPKAKKPEAKKGGRGGGGGRGKKKPAKNESSEEDDDDDDESEEEENESEENDESDS